MILKILISTLFLIPTLTFAAATYDLIAPIGTLTGPVDLKTYLEGIFTTIIGIAGVLAVFMLVWCGIKLMGTGSVSGRSAAKECIFNAIFGLLLAIGSWIILNTINPLLLKSDGEITVTTPTGIVTPIVAGSDPIPTTPGWYFRYKDGTITKNSPRFDTAASCIGMKESQKTTSPGSIDTSVAGYVGLECWEVVKTAAPAGETGARNSLCGNNSCVSNSSTGVFINHPSCAYYGAKGCTNVEGLPVAAITTIKALSSSAGVNVVITGGTESWAHQTHGPGLAVFDLRHNTILDTFIKTQDPSSKRASFSGNTEWLYNGFWYTDEVNPKESHWHACQLGSGPNYCRPK